MSAHPSAAAAAPIASIAGFRDSGVLTRCLKLFLWLAIILGALSLGSELLQLDLLNEIKAGRTPPREQVRGNDLRQQIIAIATFVNFVVLIVIFCIWIYRANYNARQLGATGMKFSPGWAVGWYFIPIANLWKPYQAMCKIWQASAAPASWQDQPRGSILPLWWTFFLLSNFTANMSGRLSLRAASTSELIWSSTVSAASSIFDVASNVVALALVSQIYRMQMARRSAEAFD
jgi:uncharacterized protein DUF4328